MNFFKKTLPLLLAFIFGIMGIVLQGGFIPHKVTEDVFTATTKGLILIGAVTAFLGIYYLLRMHCIKIKRKNEGWGYSVLVWIGFLLMMIAAVYNDGKWFWVPEANTGALTWLYRHTFSPCQETMFSILAFFIASAAYRTFRAKSVEAGILLLAAIIAMFGAVPVSTLVSENFPLAKQWLLDVPNAAVKRAIYFGIALGVVSTSLRIIFGIEKSYLGGE